jgi:hypothetical protein
MSFENMQSTMQFILDEQARYTMRLQDLEQAFVTVTQLLRNMDERLADSDERTTSLNNDTKTHIESLYAFEQAQREDLAAQRAAGRLNFVTKIENTRNEIRSAGSWQSLKDELTNKRGVWKQHCSS